MAISKILSASLNSGVPAASNMPAGSVIQVVSSRLTTTQSTSSSQASPASTTLSATITPQFSTSKIYISVCSSGGQNTAGRSGFFYIYGNGTSIMKMETGDGNAQILFPICLNYYDSPATTSACTYTVYFATDGVGTIFFATANTPSTIVLMEVAA